MKDGQTGNTLRWFALVAVSLGATTLLIAATRSLDALPGELSQWQVREAEAQQADGEWLRVSLPRVNDASDSTQPVRPARYRTNITSSPAAPRALLVSETFGRTDVYLDDVHVGGGGLDSSSRPGEPLFLLLPEALGSGEGNTLTIRVSGGTRSLGTLHVGPSRTLRPAYEALLAMKVRARQIILSVLLGAALMMALLFSLRPGERHYGWFSVTALACALHLALSLGGAPSLAPHYRGSLTASAAGWAVLAAMLFINHMIDRRPGVFERAMVAAVSVLTIVTLVSSSAFMAATFHGVTLAMGAYACVLLIGDLQRHWRTSTALLLVVASLVVAAHAHDRAFPSAPSIMAYTAVPVLAVVGSLILARFAAALNSSEALNREFDRRVAASNLELERGFARLEAIQREQALSEERQRIMRDMHDGIGGQLLQAVSSVEAEPDWRRLAPRLRASLDDLRLVVDSFADGEGNLAGALATMRWRMQRRCQQSQASFEWRVAGVDSSARFRTEDILRTLRTIRRGVELTLARGTSAVQVQISLDATAAQPAIHVEVARDSGEPVFHDGIAIHGAADAEHTA